MRLIDADELLAKVNKIKYLRKLRAKMLCDECREVEAIPIEWVEKYLASLFGKTSPADNDAFQRACGVGCMLDSWRKENGL